VPHYSEEGVPVDRAALAARISTAVAEVVKKQVASGVDLVNDGEMSKPSYATYVKDRLTGFAGSSNTFVYLRRRRSQQPNGSGPAPNRCSWGKGDIRSQTKPIKLVEMNPTRSGVRLITIYLCLGPLPARQARSHPPGSS
jgi:hypothetical protein